MQVLTKITWSSWPEVEVETEVTDTRVRMIISWLLVSSTITRCPPMEETIVLISTVTEDMMTLSKTKGYKLLKMQLLTNMPPLC